MGQALTQKLPVTMVTGEYGAMPSAARNWSEAGGLLCEVLAAELAHYRQAAGQGTPSAAKTMESPLPSNAEPGLQHRVREAEYSGAHDVHNAATTDAQHPHNGVASRKRKASPVHATHSTVAAHQPAGEAEQHRSKQSHVVESCSKADEALRCTVQWPDLLEGASSMLAGPQSDAKRKSIPEPPNNLAAAVCAAWAALSADCKPQPGQQHSAMEGGTAAARPSIEDSAGGNVPENEGGTEGGGTPEAPQPLQLIADAQKAGFQAAEAEKSTASGAGQDTGSRSSVELPGPAQAFGTSNTKEQHATGASQEKPCRTDMQEAIAEPSVPQQLWPNACHSFQALTGPAGFLSCSQAPPINQELRFALQKEMSSLGDMSFPGMTSI